MLQRLEEDRHAVGTGEDDPRVLAKLREHAHEFVRARQRLDPQRCKGQRIAAASDDLAREVRVAFGVPRRDDGLAEQGAAREPVEPGVPSRDVADDDNRRRLDLLPFTFFVNLRQRRPDDALRRERGFGDDRRGCLGVPAFFDQSPRDGFEMADPHVEDNSAVELRQQLPVDAGYFFARCFLARDERDL